MLETATVFEPGVGCGTIDRIAVMASRMMATPVSDKTGLQGRFEYALFYAMDGPRSVGGVAIPLEASPANLNLPSFPTALREQLGLTLEAGRVAVDIVVIESVERPTPNQGS